MVLIVEHYMSWSHISCMFTPFLPYLPHLHTSWPSLESPWWSKSIVFNRRFWRNVRFTCIIMPNQYSFISILSWSHVKSIHFHLIVFLMLVCSFAWLIHLLFIWATNWEIPCALLFHECMPGEVLDQSSEVVDVERNIVDCHKWSYHTYT